jgi:integrase/recombinase XerD
MTKPKAAIGSDSSSYRQSRSELTSPRLRLVQASTNDASCMPPDAAACGNAVIRRGDSPHSRRAYEGDLECFFGWLDGAALGWTSATTDDLDRYRDWLRDRYARSTANRRLVVVRLFFREAHRRGAIERDPADGLRGIRGRDQRDGGALTLEEARRLLESLRVDLEDPPHRLRALRDRAILLLLIQCGLRRAELSAVCRADFLTDRGHRVLTIDGKGGVRRTAKLAPVVAAALDAWLEAAIVAGASTEASAPLFVAVHAGGSAGFRPLSDRSVFDIVRRRLVQAEISHIGPHGLRATFVTLALKGGAPLPLVQRAAGHADPRTTERYWRRASSLDDHASDYVRL